MRIAEGWASPNPQSGDGQTHTQTHTHMPDTCVQYHIHNNIQTHTTDVHTRKALTCIHIHRSTRTHAHAYASTHTHTRTCTHAHTCSHMPHRHADSNTYTAYVHAQRTYTVHLPSGSTFQATRWLILVRRSRRHTKKANNRSSCPQTTVSRLTVPSSYPHPNIYIHIHTYTYIYIHTSGVNACIHTHIHTYTY